MLKHSQLGHTGAGRRLLARGYPDWRTVGQSDSRTGEQADRWTAGRMDSQAVGRPGGRCHLGGGVTLPVADLPPTLVRTPAGPTEAQLGLPNSDGIVK